MKILLLAAIFGLISCAKQGTEVKPENGKDDFNVTLLFTQNECSVYRFIDNGGYKYFTNCGATTQRVSCGKNCYKDETID